ncbi:MAG: hypothetical protein SGILL_006992 [Bacillariaceae sp.]
MDSSLSSANMSEFEDDFLTQSPQKKKQYRPPTTFMYRGTSTGSTTIASGSSYSDQFFDAQSESEGTSSSRNSSENYENASTASSSHATFIPPTGLEERFQKLLTLHEQPTATEEDVDKVTQQEVDKLLYAKDMYELSMEAREQVLWDIHGVAAELIDETVEFIEQKRRELSQALLKAPTSGTAAYSMALLQNASLIQSSEFQLPFLRCEQWNPQAAAQKILDYFEIKLRLFGQEKLTKHPITVSDFDKESRKCLEGGFFQLLQSRDVAGRAIMVVMPMCHFEGEYIDNLLRAYFYMIMVATQDVETQRKGLILMGCNVGPQRRVDRRLPWNVHKVRQALPLRTMGIHYCYDDIRMMPMMTIGMLVSSASSRVRFRAHYGKLQDINYKLTTFGIPDQCLPVTAEGEPKIKGHRAWVKARKKQEDQEDIVMNAKMVVVPGRVDVLLGRGKPIQEHFGNLRYHVLLDHYQQAYESAKKFEKMQVAQKVVDLVHEYSGRFLKQEGAGWIEVEELVAREKVSHAFRTRRTSNLNNTTSESEGNPATAKRPNPAMDA